MTLQQLAERPETIPTATTWYLVDLGRALGKQELFTRQAPQKLKALREHALIESAVSSNRIEGVEVDQARVGTIVFGKSVLRDRDEEEVRGYRDALKLYCTRARLTLSPPLPCTRGRGLGRGGIESLQKQQVLRAILSPLTLPSPPEYRGRGGRGCQIRPRQE